MYSGGKYPLHGDINDRCKSVTKTFFIDFKILFREVTVTLFLQHSVALVYMLVADKLR